MTDYKLDNKPIEEFEKATEERHGLVKLSTVNDNYEGEIREGMGISPFSFHRTIADTNAYGVTKQATIQDLHNGKEHTGYSISPLTLSRLDASETQKGLVKIAPDIIEKYDNNDVLTSKHMRRLENLLSEMEESLNGFGTPIGMIGLFPKDKAPNGWLIADGTHHLKSSLSDLYDYLGSEFSVNNTHFKLPDYSGYFLRGHDPTSKIDPDGKIRKWDGEQGDAIRNITGTIGWYKGTESEYDGTGVFGGGRQASWVGSSSHSGGSPGGNVRYNFDTSRVVPTSSENRPKNKVVVVYIKAFNVNIDTNSIQLDQLLDSYKDLSERVFRLENVPKTKNSFYENPNGWFKDESSGLMLQWGREVSATGNLKFNIPFPNICLAVFGTNTTSQGARVDATYARVIDNTQFHMRTKGSGGNISSFPSAWLAIGY